MSRYPVCYLKDLLQREQRPPQIPSIAVIQPLWKERIFHFVRYQSVFQFFQLSCKKIRFLLFALWLINWPMRGSIKLKTENQNATRPPSSLPLPEALHLAVAPHHVRGRHRMRAQHTPQQFTLQRWLELFWNVNELLARTSAVRYSGHDTQRTHELLCHRYDIHHHHKQI